MYKLALLFATSLFALACSDPPAYTIDCSRGVQSDGATTINCGDGNGDGNVVGSPGTTSTAPPNEQDAGPSPGPLCPVLAASPWYRADGTKALWPNFVAPSDGAEWIFPLPSGTTVEYTVMISQHGPDAPTVPANLTAVVYDNMGAARPSTDVIDKPSADKHLIGARPRSSGDGDTVVLVLQAPTASAGADAGLWIWGAPACD